MSNEKEPSTQLIEEALNWPENGPGTVIWDDFMQRAHLLNEAGAAHEVLADLVDKDRSDGLSVGDWQKFLREAMLLRTSTVLSALATGHPGTWASVSQEPVPNSFRVTD